MKAIDMETTEEVGGNLAIWRDLDADENERDDREAAEGIY